MLYFETFILTLLSWILGLNSQKNSLVYDYNDYMNDLDKNKIIEYCKELVREITHRVHQTDQILQEFGNEFVFELGFILGQIREKHKLQMEFYRQAINKYEKKSVLYPPDFLVRNQERSIHYFLIMEQIHRKELEIDALVEALIRIPKNVLDQYPPTMDLPPVLPPGEVLEDPSDDPDDKPPSNDAAPAAPPSNDAAPAAPPSNDAAPAAPPSSDVAPAAQPSNDAVPAAPPSNDAVPAAEPPAESPNLRARKDTRVSKQQKNLSQMEKELKRKNRAQFLLRHGKRMITRKGLNGPTCLMYISKLYPQKQPKTTNKLNELLVFAGPPLARAQRDLHLYLNSYWFTQERMFQTMRAYYHAGEKRVEAIKDKRFEFENTKEYEEGYLMGEIIERYRMMVEQVRAMNVFKSYNYIDCLLRLEEIQKIYLEVYHLVNMMHELPRKYGEVTPEADGNINFNPDAPLDSEELPTNMEDLERYYHQAKDKETKKKLKRHSKKLKNREEILKQLERWTPFRTVRYSRWPLEYGWEIDRW